MNRYIKISMTVLLIAFTAVATANASFNVSDVERTKLKEVSTQDFAKSVTSAGQIADTNEQKATKSSSGKGSGFYMAIYEDTVKNPNKRVEEAIKKRFGVDFKVDLSPAQQSGKLIFTDFFKDPITASFKKDSSVPTLKSSLATDCVRIKAAQAEDVKRRWDLVKKRLGERSQAMEDGDIEEAVVDPEAEAAFAAEVINRELLNRLIGQVDERSDERLAQAISEIPDATSLNEQDTLLRCYSDFSREVDFELRLQKILHPTRKQMEVLSTFMNDRLDDFSDKDSLFGSTFPRYDLLFDIDVIDYIIFGSPVSTTAGITGQSGVPIKQGGFSNYSQIADLTTSFDDGSSSTGGRLNDPSRTGSSGTANETDGSPATEDGGFGSSTGSFAGPFCADDLDGLDLDLRLLDPDESADAIAGTRTRAERDAEEEIVELPPLADLDDLEAEEDAARDGLSDTGEGSFQSSPNLSVNCEGTIGVDFGNEFLRLLFCINVGFTKQGKTWTAVRDEDCIACHVYRMNEVFEEYVLSSSVRPHKNTGTIMESAVCEDGYGDDIGFHFFLEKVPVKLFPNICYPESGNGSDDAARKEYAEMVGYPEVLHRTDRQTMYVQCLADFKKKDQERCKKALLGKTELSYEELRTAYLSDIKRAYKEDVKDRLQELEQIKKEGNVWANLAGNHGIAQRELHVFLYRLGQVKPQFEEDEEIEQDYKDRQDALAAKIKAIDNRTDLSDLQKTEQYLCLKGFALAAQKNREVTYKCDAEDTLVALEDDIITERNRVMRLTDNWNTQSRDFNKENKCATFSGSGIVDSFLETFDEKTDSGYFFETDYRKTQTIEQQITGQIVNNADLTDFDSLFTEINNEVEFIAGAQFRKKQQEQFQTDQERGLQIMTAFAAEMSSFRSNMMALTDWWSEMVDEKQFQDKGGNPVNVLKSFQEKLK